MRFRNRLLATGAFVAGAVFAQSPAQQMLDAHNAVREKVHVAPLPWSDHLADIAQQWAKHLIATGEFALCHYPETVENLYEIEGASAAPGAVVIAWAVEVKDYSYSTNACN